MKVLSLFDGMSCGQIALRLLGADIDTYYASEIDKYAIQQTMLNFPNTITQQYKMLGNGWTVEVIKHIFSFLPPSLLHGDNQCNDGEQQ